MTIRTIRIVAITGGLLLGFGLAAGVVVVNQVAAPSERIVGALLLLIAMGEWRLTRQPRSTADYELGRIEGHREGYEAGRRAGIAVVPMLCRCTDVAGSCGHRAAAPREARSRQTAERSRRVESATCSTVGGD